AHNSPVEISFARASEKWTLAGLKVTMLTDGISRPAVIHLYRPPLSWRNGGRPYSTTDIHSQERTFTERVHPCIHFERPHRRMINCVRFTWNCGRFTLNRPRFT